MFKAKRKNDGAAIGWGRGVAFVIAWAASYLLPMMALSALLSIVPLFGLMMNQQINLMVAALYAIGLFLSSLMQAALVRQALGRTMRGWLLHSLAGAIIALLMQFYHLSHDTQPLNLGVMFLPLAFMQTRTLWRHVRGAWLWPLAHVAGTLIYTQGLTSNTSHLPILYFLVYGLTMYLLWTQPREAEKANIAHEAADEDDAARAGRLQESDDDPLSDTIEREGRHAHNQA